MTLETDGIHLTIRDEIDGDILAVHMLARGKGELVSNRHHQRDTSSGLNTIQDNLMQQLQGCDEAGVFLTQIRRLKPRYCRDQFTLVEKVIGTHGIIITNLAIRYCVTHSLFSAVELRDAALYFAGCLEDEMEEIAQAPNIVFMPNTTAAIAVKRSLKEYEQAARGGELRGNPAGRSEETTGDAPTETFCTGS